MSVITIQDGDLVTQALADIHVYEYSGDLSKCVAVDDHAYIRLADVKACSNFKLGAAVFVKPTNCTNNIRRYFSGLLSKIGASLRTKLTLPALDQVQAGQKHGMAMFALALGRSLTGAAQIHKSLAGLDTPRIVASSVAGLARGYEVIRGVIATVFVEMVDYELTNTRAVSWEPFDWPSTPVTRVWTWADFTKEHALVLIEITTHGCERVLGIANANVAVVHPLHYSGLRVVVQ